MGGKVLELQSEKIIMEATKKGLEQGLERGLEKGEQIKLISLIRKKWLKGKNIEEIAEALEEDEKVISVICKLIEKYPDQEIEQLYEEYTSLS